MISAPRMMPLTRPMMLPTPSTSLVTKPSAIIGAAPRWPPGHPPTLPGRPRPRRAVRRRWPGLVGDLTDLIGLVGHAADGGHDDAGHQQRAVRARPAPAARVGFSLCRWSTPTSGLKMMASTAANEHREHDLAQRGEHDDDDDCGGREPDEGPRPHPELGHRGPAGGRLDGHRVAAAGRRLAAIGDVGFDMTSVVSVMGIALQALRVGGSGHVHESSVLWNAWRRLSSSSGCWQRWAGALGECLRVVAAHEGADPSGVLGEDHAGAGPDQDADGGGGGRAGT